MRIFTYIRGEKDPELCEQTTWGELIDDGWQFIGMSGMTNHALMTRGGYINEFWRDD